MWLDDKIVWAFKGASGLHIFCDASKREEIAEFFEETFAKYWSEAEDAVEKEFGNCDDKDSEYGSPASASVVDRGVLVKFKYLDLRYGDGWSETEGFANKALKKSLRRLLREYPDVSYEGYCSGIFESSVSAEAWQWEFTSEDGAYNDDKVYDFVGEKIASEMETYAEYFWRDIKDFWLFDWSESDKYDENMLYRFKAVLHCFYMHSRWLPEDSCKRILDLAEEFDREMPHLETQIKPALEQYYTELKSGKTEKPRENLYIADLEEEGYLEALEAISKADEEAQNRVIDAELDEEDAACQ